jgi:hypothetical protein
MTVLVQLLDSQMQIMHNISTEDWMWKKRCGKSCCLLQLSFSKYMLQKWHKESVTALLLSNDLKAAVQSQQTMGVMWSHGHYQTMSSRTHLYNKLRYPYACHEFDQHTCESGLWGYLHLC